MKIAFVQNFWYEYLGVMSIAATVKEKGHEARAFINDFEKDLILELKKFDPDVIGFPIYSGSSGWVFKTAKICKKKFKKIIVLGGPHATFFPDIINNPGVDIVCRGEGEYPILDLLEALKTGKSINKIPNLWVKVGKKVIKNPVRPLINPLDKLPKASREIYYRYPVLFQNRVKNFNIGRGCPYNCAYCHNSGLMKIYSGLGSYVRNFEVNRAIEEIILVKENFPLKTVCFVDDTFIANSAWLLKFLPLYKNKVGLPFSCNVRGNLLDETLVKNLAKAGCVSVFMGVESGNEKMRLQLLNKLVTNQQIKKSAKLLHKYGIKLAANNMIGLPEESLEDAFLTVKLNSEIKVDFPWCSIFQPFPGTAIADYCLSKGIISQKDIEKIGETFQKRSVLKSANINNLVNLHKLFHLAVKFPLFIPLVKLLIKLPLTPVYDFIFLINQGLTYKRLYKLNMRDFIPYAWHFGKFYLLK